MRFTKWPFGPSWRRLCLFRTIKKEKKRTNERIKNPVLLCFFFSFFSKSNVLDSFVPFFLSFFSYIRRNDHSLFRPITDISHFRIQCKSSRKNRQCVFVRMPESLYREWGYLFTQDRKRQTETERVCERERRFLRSDTRDWSKRISIKREKREREMKIEERKNADDPSRKKYDENRFPSTHPPTPSAPLRTSPREKGE